MCFKIITAWTWFFHQQRLGNSVLFLSSLRPTCMRDKVGSCNNKLLRWVVWMNTFLGKYPQVQTFRHVWSFIYIFLSDSARLAGNSTLRFPKYCMYVYLTWILHLDSTIWSLVWAKSCSSSLIWALRDSFSSSSLLCSAFLRLSLSSLQPG